jgi:hypothetical protein
MNEIINGTEIRSIKNPIMTLITKDQMKQLTKAGHDNMVPLVKLFMGPLTWLVTGIEDEILYGYGDVGQGCVEWGSLTTTEYLPSIEYRFGFLERDRYYKVNNSISPDNYFEMKSLVGI